MISAEALAALGGLERGARYNLAHRVSRELINSGLAQPDWGHLGLTEAGRIYLRRGRFNIAITGDDNVADMSVSLSSRREIDPMAAPHRAHTRVDAAADEPEAEPVIHVELLPEAPPAPLPIAETRKQEMMRAAGVASGKTGVWVDEKWVEEFVRALDGDK